MSLGPLTKAFTPPASCLTGLFEITSVGQFDYFQSGALTTGSCLPPGYKEARSNFFSPGVCPQGFTSACSSLNIIGSLTETVVTCCPLFYTCNGNTGLFFESTLGCRSAFVNATLTRYTQILNGAVTSTRGLTVLSGAGAINAYSVQVRFQSTDFQPTGPGATAPPTSRPLASTLLPAPTTSAAPPPGGVGGGISAAAAAGIAVAVTLLVLAVVGAGCFMLYLRRKKRRQQQQQQAGGQAAAYVESGGVTPGGGAGGVSYYGPPSSTSPELSKQLQTAGAGYGFQQQQQPRHRPLEVEQHELAGWSPGGPPVELDHGQGVARPS